MQLIRLIQVCICLCHVDRCQIMEVRVRTPDLKDTDGEDGRTARARPPGAACELLAQWQTICYLFQGRICNCE